MNICELRAVRSVRLGLPSSRCPHDCPFHVSTGRPGLNVIQNQNRTAITIIAAVGHGRMRVPTELHGTELHLSSSLMYVIAVCAVGHTRRHLNSNVCRLYCMLSVVHFIGMTVMRCWYNFNYEIK